MQNCSSLKRYQNWYIHASFSSCLSEDLIDFVRWSTVTWNSSLVKSSWQLLFRSDWIFLLVSFEHCRLYKVDIYLMRFTSPNTKSGYDGSSPVCLGRKPHIAGFSHDSLVIDEVMYVENDNRPRPGKWRHYVLNSNWFRGLFSHEH